VLLIGLVSCLGHRAAVGQESLDDRIPSDYLVAGVFDGRAADAEDIADREREIWEVLGPMYSELSLAIPVLNWNDMPVELRDAWIEEEIGAAFLESQIVFYNRLEGDPAMSAVPGMGVMISEGRFASFVDRFVRMIAADGGVGLERLRIDGAKIQRTVFRRELSLTFGTMDGYYVVTLGGPDELEWWLEQQEKGAPESWTSAQQRVATGRRWLSLNVEVARLKSMFEAMARPRDLEPLAAIGVDSVRSVALQAGFDDDGYVHRLWVDCPEGPRGIFGLFEASADSPIAGLAQDASAVLAIQADVIGGLAELAVEPKADRNVPSPLERAAAALGPGLVLQYSFEDGGPFVGGSMILPVDDAKLARQLERNWIESMLEQPVDDPWRWWGPPRIDSMEYRGETIHWYSPGRFNPFGSLAWTITDDHLVMALSPMTIKPTIDRLQGVLASADFDSSDSVGLDFRFRLADTLGTPSGMGQFFAKVLIHEGGWDLRRDVEWNRVASRVASCFPDSVTLDAILLDEERISVTSEADGLSLEARMTMPGSELVLLGAVAGALAAVADQAGVDVGAIVAPVSAARVQNQNNLRQIGLALHNYHDTFRRFPPQAITDDNGRPLLSWRVAILPYIEQQQLYDQFHHDEPWDSEHNLALLERMPAVFRDPLSEAEPGMTTFLGISGDAGIFPEDREGVRIAEIIDGTSNTLMVIKGPEESAIEWTRPSDLTPDMNLLDQFFGELEESFLGLTADGAVHTFDRDTDEAMIRALITRGGREVIEW
ncbi:MAG: DUF1559 domain-containing protein, partial [Planctomycetales bacterium]|nr:DUF1559 domain-containing protein [Planctomycetales bacterium]